MPAKFQLITELYDQTVQSVTGSYQSWTGFLRAACYNYKCPFDDQILIYAQRPDATAVLEMERWNKRFGRWVNRGAKSIAVFGDDGQNCLKLYFDVSDTHASRFARPLPIWTMHPAFEPEVIETLEATFGNLAEKENLADAVRSACHNAVADNFTDYLQDLRDCREDSLLEELDDLNLEAFYRDALEVSVAYMLMTRLGLRADDYFTADEFAHVYEFNTPPTINALGIATSDIAEMGLREISRTVMQAQRDQFFANRARIGYDDRTEQHETPHERSEQHGGHLQDAERISGAEPADAADAGGASGQVRGAAERISDEAPQSALHQPENQRQADGTSLGDRAGRAEDDGADSGADGTGRGRDGGTEGDRSPALDGPDEQSPAQRGGTGADRPDLRLTTQEPTEAGSDELPAFVDHSGDYVLLDRLRADCDYFLGAGGRSEKHLWAGNVHAQIKKMRELYDALPEKPEWLTAEAIDRYAAQMAAPYQVAAYHHFENGFDDKLDYQTLEEAEAAAQGYVAGTMEEDGFAYPAEVRASEENGVYRLEKVYYLTATDDPTTIPTADFEREGRTYTLLDLLKNDQTETDTREHIEVVTLESKTKDMAEILKMLEPKLEVKTEDGYEGVLSLDHTTIQVEAAGYGTSSRTVTAGRTYPNLSDADVSLVPKSVNENGRTLTLADVSWQEAAVDPTDGYDIPIRYTAVASYTGTATSKYATGYTVTADYKGDVTRTSCDTVIYTAVFSSVGAAASSKSGVDFNWLWLLLPVGAAALGGCGYAGYKGYRHYINKKRGYAA